MDEIDGILKTAERVAPIVATALWDREHIKWFPREITREWVDLDAASWGAIMHEGKFPFEFREVLGLSNELQPDLNETRPEIMAEIYRRRPGIVEAVKVSQELDRELGGRGPERKITS